MICWVLFLLFTKETVLEDGQAFLFNSMQMGIQIGSRSLKSRRRNNMKEAQYCSRSVIGCLASFPLPLPPLPPPWAPPPPPSMGSRHRSYPPCPLPPLCRRLPLWTLCTFACRRRSWRRRGRTRRGAPSGSARSSRWRGLQRRLWKMHFLCLMFFKG